MEYVYHIVTIRVNETSWAHVWRLRSRYLGTGYDMRQLPEVGEAEVANKGGIRGEGTAGRLLAMARRTATLGRLARGRKTRAGPAHQQGRRGEGRVGWPKATGLAGRCAGMGERIGGPWLGQKPEMGQSSKRISFRISIDFRIW
jgi:hypothetical protein